MSLPMLKEWITAPSYSQYESKTVCPLHTLQNNRHYFSSVASSIGLVDPSGWSMLLFNFSSSTVGLPADLCA